MAVKRTRFLGIRVTEEYQQLLERCNGRQLAVWMREPCLDTRPARSLRLPSIDPVLLLPSLPGWGTTSTRSPGKLTAAIDSHLLATVGRADGH